MNLYGSTENLEQEIEALFPGARRAIGIGKHIHAQMLPYQAMALYGLTKDYNREGAHIQEIGTASGFSAAIMAIAAPKAKIITLNCAHHEIEAAQINLEEFKSVTVVEAISWDYLAHYTGPYLDMIFVDGNHRQVARDMTWFNWLSVGGLMLFHDYSILSSNIVYETVNKFVSELGRPLDVSIIDADKVGMAGLYRQEGEFHKP